MFEGLRDTLDRFKQDVEEQAEDEEAEAVDASAADDAGAAAEAGERPETDADGERRDAADDGERRDAADDGERRDGAEGAETDDAGESRGLAERAKLFATGQTVIQAEDLDGPLEDLELALLGSDVEMSVAQELIADLRERLIDETRAQVTSTERVVDDALREALVDVMSVGQFDFEQRVREAEKPVVIVFTGVNGVGKTTSIAKLGRRLEDRGISPVLANGDTYRAGANEQLREHAEALDLPCIAHDQGGDPAAVIYDAVEYAQANDVDVVLGDTAGRLHTSDDLMAQLSKIDRVVDPDMTLFVDEAVAGQDAVNRAREFDDAAAIDGAILTKADADAKGGAAISIARVTGKPVLFLGTGQGYDDLIEFDPEDLVDRLLGEDEA